MKFCSVYALKEEFYFVTNAKYKDGVGSISLPIFKESKFETKEDLSKRLKECLDAYTLDKELPEKASDLLKPLLKITKCNSYKEFVKLSNLIEVAYIDDSIKIQPLARAKNFKGFESYKGLIFEFTKKELENNTVIKGILELFIEMENI